MLCNDIKKGAFKMKAKRILSAIIAGVMALGMMNFTALADDGGVSVWDGETYDTSWYNTTDTEFEISTAAEFAGMAVIVNGSAENIEVDSFKGKTITLTEDINLNDKEWTPIGYMGKSFKGTFDGNNKTVKNLTITKTLENASANNGIGIFGRTDSPAVIENLTIENVDITGSLYVGAVVGHGYTGTAVENCTVKGNIAIDAWWYAGVIGGNGYMNLINNCYVIGNTDSYIKGNNGSYIGGIWGFRGEGKNNITNCTVKNLAISGVDRVGGISGIAHYQNTIGNNSIENVAVTANDSEATTIGLIAGANQGGENEGTTALPSYVINNSVAEDCFAYVNETEIIAHSGSTIGGKTPKSTVVGVDVVLDENNKVTSGTLETISDSSMIAEGYEIDETGSVVESTPVTNNVAQVDGVMYESLQEALNAGGNIVMLRDVTLTDSITITDGTIAFDLNGYTLNGNIKVESAATVEIKNGKITNENSSVSAVETVGATTFKNVDITSARHAVRIEGGTATITGGTYKVTGTAGMTTHVINAGGASASYSTVVINDGTFIGPKGTAADSGAAVNVQVNSTVTINGGAFTGGKANTVSAKGALTIKGGSFDQAPTAYVAEGYKIALKADGTYSVGKLPNAEVKNLGAITVDEYGIYNGSSLIEGGEPIDLQVAMEFLAKDTPEEAAENIFADYITDFYITIEGIEGDSFVADGCYLAGEYGDFGWIMIPLDGMTIEEGVVYPVITSVGLAFSYEDICTSVVDFNCGIYFSDAVINANPDMQVTLTLGLSESMDKAQNAEFLTVDEPYTYKVKDFGKTEAKWTTDTDAGYYVKDGNKLGVMRFLFLAEGLTGSKVGISYIRENGEVAKTVENEMEISGEGSVAFYGDIKGFTKEDAKQNSYSARGFVGDSYSDILSCAPDFEKLLDYDE